jgi:hypothetical protein
MQLNEIVNLLPNLSLLGPTNHVVGSLLDARKHCVPQVERLLQIALEVQREAEVLLGHLCLTAGTSGGRSGLLVVGEGHEVGVDGQAQGTGVW